MHSMVQLCSRLNAVMNVCPQKNLGHVVAWEGLPLLYICVGPEGGGDLSAVLTFKILIIVTNTRALGQAFCMVYHRQASNIK